MRSIFSDAQLFSLSFLLCFSRTLARPLSLLFALACSHSVARSLSCALPLSFCISYFFSRSLSRCLSLGLSHLHFLSLPCPRPRLLACARTLSLPRAFVFMFSFYLPRFSSPAHARVRDLSGSLARALSPPHSLRFAYSLSRAPPLALHLYRSLLPLLLLSLCLSF